MAYCSRCDWFDAEKPLLSHRCSGQKKVVVVPVEPVANVANAVANVVTKRYAKWRAANPELYRERQRGYARKYRAKAA